MGIILWQCHKHYWQRWSHCSPPPPTPSLWAAPANLWVTVATKSKSIAYFRARAWNYIIFHLTFAFCLLFPFPHSQFFAFCFSIFLLITTPRAAVGNQGVSNGNNGSGSCAWAASHWLGVQISALIWFLIIILCPVSSRNTRRAQQRKAAKSRKRISRVTRLKVCSKIFSFIAACQVCCVRVHGAMRVCLCVCVRRCVLLFHLCNLLPRFVSFRFVWFGFVLVFVFMLLFFRLPSLRHSSIIHIDFFCFSPLPTPLSSALLMFLVFRCPKMFLLIFLYIFCVLCYLLFVGFACDSHVNNWQNSTGKCTKKSRAFVEVMVRNGAYQWLKEVKTGWPFRSNLSFILLRSLWEFSRVASTTVEL